MNPLAVLSAALAFALAVTPTTVAQSKATQSKATQSRTTLPEAEPVRGITISTHGSGRDWGTEVMAPTLADIKALGSGWVAIHPYARIQKDGTVRFRPIDPANPPALLAHPIAEAHRLGLKILIKPHLSYWGNFSWRGAIEFPSDEAWQRFWSTYTAWILQLAAACKEADGFVVGTELDRSLGFEKEWRELIAGVRSRAAFPLTYAANWSDYRRVGFWDALDVIGIQGYFPVAERPNAKAAEIRAGWQQLTAELRGYAQQNHRNVLLTELGYNRSFKAAVQPWDYRTDGAEAEELQALCMRIALESIEREPSIVGAFLWKWFPHPRPVGRNFQLATPKMRAAITAAWTE